MGRRGDVGLRTRGIFDRDGIELEGNLEIIDGVRQLAERFVDNGEAVELLQNEGLVIVGDGTPLKENLFSNLDDIDSLITTTEVIPIVQIDDATLGEEIEEFPIIESDGSLSEETDESSNEVSREERRRQRRERRRKR